MKELAVLSYLVRSHKSSVSFKSTCFVCTQHFLSSTVNLVKALITLGASPSNIFITTKNYSYHLDIAKQLESLGINVFHSYEGPFQEAYASQIQAMWHQAKTYNQEKNLIVLGDGGRCIEYMPMQLHSRYRIVSIEQTTFGFHHLVERPCTIDVARSAVKKLIEPLLISKVILEKVRNWLHPRKNIGIIGIGAIGTAVAQTLLDEGFNVLLFDTKLKYPWRIGDIQVSSSLTQLIHSSDCIFGCTGQDIFYSLNDFSILSEKILISCSSENIEFLSILKKINALNSAPIGDIYHCSNEIKNLVILNGGYPINFSQKSISVPDREIQLTRGLLLSACIQAQKILNNKKNKPDSNLLMLEPSLQQSVVRQWEKETIWLKEKKDLLKQFSKLEWIINHSSGYYQHGHNAPKEITDNRPEHSLDQIAST